jgi:hypothetical protein
LLPLAGRGGEPKAQEEMKLTKKTKETKKGAQNGRAYRRAEQATSVVLHPYRFPAFVTAMAWERRERGERYYTRSRRAEGKVVREYVGGGALGEFAARIDTEERERWEAEAARGRAEVKRLEELAAPVVQLYEVAEALARAHLIATGCHSHKGEWRRRRERRN